MNALKEFLEARREKFGTFQKLASNMGDITFSGLLRGVKKGGLSVENCLRLAEVLGEEPSVVCRVAQQAKFADQLDRLYDKTANPMTEEERDVVNVWRRLPAERRSAWLYILSDDPYLSGQSNADDGPTGVSAKHHSTKTRRRHDGELSEATRKKKRSA